jgi:exopolyphosphatase / guanosine-5'-triphosphate,3'-diphosphate pyrophosphatase
VIRVAALDCGTNSLRLLIAELDPVTGGCQDLDRRMEIVRLGQGVDATGRIDPAAMTRTLEVTRRYAGLCRDAGVQRLRFVATSATRDAENRAEFVAGVRDLLGVEPEIIPGHQEAQLSFAGATRGLAGRHPAPFLVVDIGGGSTEFVLGADTVQAAVSVDVGCVRLTERHLPGDPPTPAELAAAAADVRQAIDTAARSVDLAGAATLVGLAGSVTTVTARALRLEAYDSAAIDGAELEIGCVEAACTDLIAASRAQRAALGFMHPGRVDVIGAGALVWRSVVRRVSAASGLTTVVTSEHDLLDGIAWSLA